jgi:hypothetical protein
MNESWANTQSQGTVRSNGSFNEENPHFDTFLWGWRAPDHHLKHWLLQELDSSNVTAGKMAAACHLPSGG